MAKSHSTRRFGLKLPIAVILEAMIVVLIRLLLLYFLWTLVRRVWRRYVFAKSSVVPNTPKSATSGNIYEAEFRVLREDDN